MKKKYLTAVLALLVCVSAGALLVPPREAAAAELALEAEDAVIAGGKIVSLDPASGGKAVSLTEEGDSVAFSVTVPAAGNYELALRYARNSAYGDAMLRVEVNDGSLPLWQLPYNRAAGEAASFTDSVRKAALSAGENTVTLSVSGPMRYEGKTYRADNAVTVDALTVREAKLTASYEFESGRLEEGQEGFPSDALRTEEVAGASGGAVVTNFLKGGSAAVLEVDVPTAGVYEAELVYAAYLKAENNNGGVPVRILVNGVSDTTALLFNTCGEGNFSVKTVYLRLAAGRNTVSFLKSVAGDMHYLQNSLSLDRLDVYAAISAGCVEYQAEEKGNAIGGSVNTVTYFRMTNDYSSVGALDAVGQGVTFPAVEVPEDGDYLVEVRYSKMATFSGGSAFNNAPAAFTVSSESGSATAALYDTVHWNYFDSAFVTLPLRVGNNRVRVEKSLASGYAELDAIRVHGAVRERPDSHPELARMDLSAAMSDLYDPGTILHEPAVFVEEEDGSVAPHAMLYDVDEAVSVRSFDLQTEYRQGVDYTVENGRLVLTQDTTIPVFSHSLFYQNGSEFNKEEAVFNFYTVYVTYKHAQAFSGARQESQISYLPATYRKLTEKKDLNVVFFGDSITYGWSNSTFFGVAPCTPTWPTLVTRTLAERHKIAVRAIDSGRSGESSSLDTSFLGASDLEKLVISHAPDLVVLQFGMNDGLNGVTGGELRENLTRILSTVRARLPQTEFLVVSCMAPVPTGQAGTLQNTYEEELDKMRGEGVGVVDFNSIHRGMLERKKYYETSGNNWNHPNDFLSRAYAQAVMAALETATVRIAGVQDHMIYLPENALTVQTYGLTGNCDIALTLNGVPYDGKAVYAAGSYTAAARVTAEDGSVYEDSRVFTVDKDSSAPLVGVAGVTQNGVYTSVEKITVTVKDNVGVRSYTVSLNGETYAGGAVTAPGDYVLTVSAEDFSGNRTERTVSFRIAEQAEVSSPPTPARSGCGGCGSAASACLAVSIAAAGLFALKKRLL